MSVLSAGAPSATLECARALTAILEHDVENIAELMTMLITKVSRMFGYHGEREKQTFPYQCRYI